LLPSKYLVKILFTASAYPGTLAASSIRGLLANLSAMALAPWIGRWADRHPSRLRSLQLTIIVQRCSICVACIGWSFLLNISLTDNDNGSGKGNNSKIRTLTMSFLVFLGMIERVSAVANILVMERDWVPALATPTSKPSLNILNAVMKWIDLVSKLVAPIFISIVAMWLKSDVELSLAIAAMNLTLLLPEWYCAQQAWRSSIELQEPKQTFLAGQPEVVPGMISGLQLYFRYDVWRTSLAMALQSYSVLSLSASMTTYLLSIHYTLAPITLARTISSVIELTSVVVMPVGVSLLRKLNGNPVFGLA
ncbi:hypothetical protein DH86_00000675, partial [Scytalidium sp. 3C]